MAGPVKRVKKKEGENLTEANIAKVVSLLEADKPITKKEACEILNISYNTTRLNKIIEEHRGNIAEAAKRRAANRGKPPTPFEIQAVIEGHLDGQAQSEIAKQLYRSSSFVKKVVEETVGLPEKSESYFSPELLPEALVSDKFKLGQIVWSTRYSALAIVTDYLPSKSEENKKDYDLYEIWVIEPMDELKPEERYSYAATIEAYGGFFATQPYFDLGSMEHLKQFGIDIYKPYKRHFSKWLSGDFSSKFGEKRWQQKLTSGVEVYAS